MNISLLLNNVCISFLFLFYNSGEGEYGNSLWWTKTILIVSINMVPRLRDSATWLRIMGTFSVLGFSTFMGPMMNKKIAWRTLNIRIRVVFIYNLINLCPDCIISTGCQMTNLVLSFEYLLLLWFLTTAEFWNLGYLQGIIEVPSKEIILSELDFF